MLNNPLVLLTGVGLALAMTVNLSKFAALAGVPGPLFAFGLAAGAGLVLAVITTMRREPVPLDRRHLAYFAVTGFVTIAAPNYLGYEVARHAGAAYASVPYALSPLVTYALAILVGLDRPSGRRIAGLVLGLLGTLGIVLTMILNAGAASPVWYVAALGLPLLVATGNVYRTLRWPKGTSLVALAAGMLLGGAAWLLPVVALDPAGLASIATANGAAVMLAQVAVSVVMNWLYFRLQHVAGPVYLSQIGYVAAGFGVAMAIMFFGETVTVWMLAGLVLIVGGVILVTPRPGKA